MSRYHLFLAVVAAVASAAPGSAQAAGVDLVLSTTAVQHGVPCAAFTQVPYFPWVTPGETWLFQVYSKPQTAHFILLGPPPTSSTAIPGIENLLLIHEPVLVLLSGVTGPVDPSSFCGQGHADYLLKVPYGPNPGHDYSLQALALSSTTGNWAFSRHQWLTYL
jgi:hypothetical protein